MSDRLNKVINRWYFSSALERGIVVPSMSLLHFVALVLVTAANSNKKLRTSLKLFIPMMTIGMICTRA